ATGEERNQLIELAKGLSKITINAWTISDLDLIGVGAFSPLTGFLKEDDYHAVVDTMRLASGTVWSIPITLSIDEATASALSVGQQAALIGEDDVLYGTINVESIYKVNQQQEAIKVFKTDDIEHPGVR